MEDLKQRVVNYLRDEKNWISAQLAKIENQTKVPREQIAAVLTGMFSLYLVVGYFAQVVCNFVGFAYPAYASMLAIESRDKSDDTQWLTYWTVYSMFSLIDFAADVISGWFPVYWLTKCAFLIYLYHPLTMGARNMYVNYARPTLQKCTGAFNRAEAVIHECQKAADAATAITADAAPPAYAEIHPPLVDPQAPAAGPVVTQPPLA